MLQCIAARCGGSHVCRVFILTPVGRSERRLPGQVAVEICSVFEEEIYIFFFFFCYEELSNSNISYWAVHQMDTYNNFTGFGKRDIRSKTNSQQKHPTDSSLRTHEAGGKEA